MLSYDFICDFPYVYRNALNSIYEMVDLDSNGSLCRNEFNMFQCYLMILSVMFHIFAGML